ncbi:MAG: nucleotidyltransferase domain-containing protein [Clostridium lundense]|nr:nucleotidyltransferase domain-containing protein [Clostridium lundense]
MHTSKDDIFDKLKADECINKFKELGLNTVMLSESIVMENSKGYSDIDIAILSENDISLNRILELEEYLEKFLGTKVDAINLRDENLDLNLKVNIYDDSMIIYSDDNLRLYNMEYINTELLYKENEIFMEYQEEPFVDI